MAPRRPVDAEARGGRVRRHRASAAGHGLSASLQALRHVTEDLTAVVTVADDGGSSGRLREEFGVLPPGDLRMALAALCDDSGWGHLWRDVLQHRFAGDGPLGGHPVGNLLIVALWQLLDGPGRTACGVVGELLGARGQGAAHVRRPADHRGRRRSTSHGERPHVVRGQGEVATTTDRVAAGPARARRSPRQPGGRRRGARRGLGRAGPRLVVHLRLPAPAGARARRGAAAPRPPGAASPSTSSAGGTETAGYRAEQLLEVLGDLAPRPDPRRGGRRPVGGRRRRRPCSRGGPVRRRRCTSGGRGDGTVHRPSLTRYALRRVRYCRTSFAGRARSDRPSDVSRRSFGRMAPWRSRHRSRTS